MNSPNPSYEQFLARKDVQNAMAFTHLHTVPIKRENSPPESPEPEPAHDNGLVKLDPDILVSKIEQDDSDESSSGDHEPDAAPAPLAALVPAQANVIQEQPGIDDTPGMVTVLSKKMNKINDLKERERACRAEMERIGVEVRLLEHGAKELFQAGSAKWLLSRIGSLSGQKAIIQMILTKIEQRNLRRQVRLRKRERERQRQMQQEAEQKRQLEAKRQSNKQQLRSQSALKMQVPHLDLTAAPKLDTKKGVKVIVKTEPEIKMEPMIKIEED